MSVFIRYPHIADLNVYSSFSAFPASATDGAMAIASDTDYIYIYNVAATSWILVGGPDSDVNPTIQTMYVNKSGNDATGNGSLQKPFLTIQAAENSISDASASKLYVIMIGPGVYAEGNSTTFRDNIFLKGSGRDVTSITGNITYTYGAASGTVQGIQDIKVANITYNPPTILNGLNRNTNFGGVIFNCYTGNITFNGDGTIKPTSPGIAVYESQIGALTINGGIANNIFRSSITSGVTLTNVPFLSAGNFLNSTVVSRDTTANTITTQSGLAYPTDGSTAGTLGGGRIRVWTGSSGPSLSSGTGFQRAVFTYTAYNASTGVFSGLTINSGSLSAITAGDVMTNEENSTVQVFHSRNSGGVTVTGTGSNSQANGTFRGTVQGAATVSGGNTLYTTDDIGMGTSATPVTYSNGALSTFNLFYSTGARGVNYNPITSANWPTSSVVAAGDVTINNKTIANFSSTTGIFEGATVTGTGIPTGSIVVSLTATTVTIDQNPTATNTGVSLTFQNVVPKSSQAALDILARRNTGDVTLGAFGSSPNANGASLTGQTLTLQPADDTHPGGVSTGAQTFAGAKTIAGSADVIQLLVKGSAIQSTAGIFQIQKNDGTTIFRADGDELVSIPGGLKVFNLFVDDGSSPWATASAGLAWTLGDSAGMADGAQFQNDGVSSNIHASANTFTVDNDLHIGADTTSNGTLTLTGTSDKNQLVLAPFSSQTNPQAVFKNTLGATITTIGPDGLINSLGNITAANISQAAEQNLGALTWTAGTAPSGTIAKTYRWSQTGKTINAWFKITATVAGVATSAVSFALPGDMPAPSMWASQPNSTAVALGMGAVSSSTDPSGTNGTCTLSKDGGGSYIIEISDVAVAATFVMAQISYLTA